MEPFVQVCDSGVFWVLLAALVSLFISSVGLQNQLRDVQEDGKR
jgi:1,4-dihydroxy-2-naphthoate octaprenyltransferase